VLHLTTYFDKNYLSRGLVLYESIKEHEKEFELYILCLDDFTLEYFANNELKFPEVRTISLYELEASDPRLKNCKTNRSLIEYYFTLSPCLPLYLLKKYSLPHICSLDADILLLDSPKVLFYYLNNYSIIITPHKFSEEIKELVTWGKYNVSFQVFKNDETGLTCLEYWRNQCIDWCGDFFDEDNDRFADQKYLDNWPALYPGKVKVLDDNTSGLAPWNLNNFKITLKENRFYSNGEGIIFYHFHHFRSFNKSWSSNGFDLYFVNHRKTIGKLYMMYWNKLKKANAILKVFQEQSVRTGYPDNLWLSIFNENVVYFNVFNKRLVYLNLTKLPVIIKRILIKLYG